MNKINPAEAVEKKKKNFTQSYFLRLLHFRTFLATVKTVSNNNVFLFVFYKKHETGI